MCERQRCLDANKELGVIKGSPYRMRTLLQILENASVIMNTKEYGIRCLPRVYSIRGYASQLFQVPRKPMPIHEQ